MSSSSESPYKVVNTQPTPNPDALKFMMNKPVVKGGTRSFDSKKEAVGDTFAEALFDVPGIRNIYLSEDFVSVTKSMMEEWHDLVEPLQGSIEKNLKFYEDGDDETKKDEITVTPEEYFKRTDEEKAIVIDSLLDQKIRPALAADGGGLIVHSVEGHKVNIHYQGACGSCPSSTTGTLKAIEGILQKSLGPEIQVHTAVI
jgi:NFU1 iron-sulfur cluster scaffold homolog, mitochondrial